MKFDLRKFKKVAHEKGMTTLQHPDGHKVQIAHAAVSPAMRGQLAAMPMQKFEQGGPVAAPKDDVPNPNKKNSAEFQKGLDQNQDYIGNAKKSLSQFASDVGLYEGGMAVQQGSDANLKENYSEDGTPRKKKPEASDSPKIDPEKAKDMEKSAMEPGYKEAQRNLNKGIGAVKHLMGFSEAGMAGEDGRDMGPVAVNTALPSMPAGLINPTPGAQFQAQQQASMPQPAAPSLDDLPYGVTPDALSPSPQQEPAAPSAGMMQASAPPSSEAPQQNNDPMGYGQQAAMQATGISNQMEGIRGQGRSEAAGMAAEARMANEAANRQIALHNEAEVKRQGIQDNIDATLKDIRDQHINPNHYMENMGARAKVASAIGLILGGIGGGITHTDNPAQQFLSQQIERDIASQHANLGKSENMLSAYMKQYGNLTDATNMARVTIAGAYADRLKAAAAQSGSATAQARAQQAMGQLQMQYAPLIQQTAIRQALTSGSEAASKIDPSMLVPMMVPAAQQKEVFAEIKRAKDTRSVRDSALANFDAIANQMKAAGGLGRIGTALYSPAEASALAAELGSTVGDQEGSVRETSMNNVKNAYLPKSTDDEARLAKRREELQTYLNLKSDAPVARGHMIDLDKFDSTRRTQPQQMQAAVPQTRVINGANYVKVQGGWKKQ